MKHLHGRRIGNASAVFIISLGCAYGAPHPTAGAAAPARPTVPARPAAPAPVRPTLPARPVTPAVVVPVTLGRPDPAPAVAVAAIKPGSIPADAPRMAPLQYTSYTAPAGAYYVSPLGTVVAPGTDPKAPTTVAHALATAPDGATIVFRGGIYRGINNYPLKKFTLQPAPHEKVWLTGSILVGGWTAQKQGAATLWRKDNWTTSFPHVWHDEWDPGHQELDSQSPMKGSRDQVFINNVPVSPASRLEDVTTGRFYLDTAAHKLYLGDDPTGKAVEVTVCTEPFRPFERDKGPKGIVIRGLGFTHYADSGLEVSSDDTVIQSCTFAWNGSAGVSYSFSRGGVLQGNILACNGQSGVAGWNVSGLTIQGNTISFNNVEGYSQTGSAGVRVGHATDLVLRNNLVEHNYTSGLLADASSTHARIYQNMVRDNAGAGFSLDAAHDSFVAFNVCATNAGAGVALRDSSDIRVYNNTLAKNGQDILVSDTARVNPNRTEFTAGITWVSRGNVFKNNILWDTTGPTGPLFDASQSETHDRSALQVAAADYNSYYRSAPGAAPLIQWTQNGRTITPYSTTAPFTAANPGYEVHSLAVTGDAGRTFFVDPTRDDYRLKKGSPAIGKGERLPVDIAEAVRSLPGAVNLGALGVAPNS